MTQVETTREKKDLLYHIINNTDAKTLSDICQHIVQLIDSKYEDKSLRFKQMLQKTLQSEDRIGKHALVFFALYQEPQTREFFMSDTPRVPPGKFKRFVEVELPILVDKLTHGAFTSLRAFTEDARWTYCTL